MLRILLVILAIATTTTPTHAVSRCRAKPLADGSITVKAKDLVGTPRWGTRYGGEVHAFDGVGTCVVGSAVRNCALAPTGNPLRTAAPAGCTLYLADGRFIDAEGALKKGLSFAPHDGKMHCYLALAAAASENRAG